MIRKEYVERDGVLTARVTFTFPESVWADTMFLVGDFNGWHRTSHPMRRVRSGKWILTLNLELGRAYQFRYLQDNDAWLNDTQADAYVCNPYGTVNFVVITDPAFHPYCDVHPL